MLQLKFMTEKWRPELLTLFTAFYDLSVSRYLFSNAEKRQFGAAGIEGLNFRDNFESILAFIADYSDEIGPPRAEHFSISVLVENLRKFARFRNIKFAILGGATVPVENQTNQKRAH